MSRRAWAPFAGSVLIYLAAAMVLGRDVLRHLSTHVANDAGDPLLTASILYWNATHLPLSDAWWQLPIFYPTRDTMAFSENLLGLSVVAAPLQWITGDALVTYNLVTLLTFPLSAAAMYALVFRLTGSAPGAFIAGLAFGFAPYRISQLPHVQMLAAFWAPLALLGLHAYLESGRRRWLALYGAAWALQAMANGYTLIFFSVLVGLWTLWFVVARGRWRALAAIAVATIVASLPLVPLFSKYVAVHARHGFERSFEEVVGFSADISALLCAPPTLTFWGWLRVGCRAEGELFPGAVVFALALGGTMYLLGWGLPGDRSRLRPMTWIARLLFGVAVVYAGIVSAILWVGPFRFAVGPLQVSASSIRKPMLVLLAALVASLVLSPGVRAAARRSSTLGFYVAAALVTWLLALGPQLTMLGEPIGYRGPFAWLMALPGADGLRVPARFWLMTMICLAAVAGIFVAEVLRRRRPAIVAVSAAVIGAGVLTDAWVARIAVQPAPAPMAAGASLAGGIVMDLPVGDYDIPSVFRAVTGGWRSVNGYSGYGPSYYPALQQAVRQEVDGALLPFQAYGELFVIVRADAPRLVALVERQPGVQRISGNRGEMVYRLPHRPRPAGPGAPAKAAIAALRSTCSPAMLDLAVDGAPDTRWVCFSRTAREELLVDLGASGTVGTVVHGLGPYYGDFPLELIVDTSQDGVTWEPAWNGSVLGQAIAGSIENPRSMRIALPFEPRRARFVRLTNPGGSEPFYWSLAELEVWSDSVREDRVSARRAGE